VFVSPLQRLPGSAGESFRGQAAGRAASTPSAVVDGLLAATALVHDLALLTRNVGDVSTTDVRILDPFAPPLLP
jgi:predicted nucleic acid-binding protein